MHTHTHIHIFISEKEKAVVVLVHRTHGLWVVGGWVVVVEKKRRKKSIRGGFYPDHPLPLYSLERGPVLEEAFILWLFVLSRERSAIFFLRPRHPQCTHTHTYTYIATVKTKMKNSTLAAKTIFYPLAWPSFTLRPPVQSIPAIIASLSPLRITHSATTTSSCALKPAGAFFSSFSFTFFPSRLLKINSTPNTHAAYHI